MVNGNQTPLKFSLNENDSIFFTIFQNNYIYAVRNIENNDCTIDIIGEKSGSSDNILIEIYKDSELFFDEIISNSKFFIRY